MSSIRVSKNVVAFSAARLGDKITAGHFVQRGIIRTEYHDLAQGHISRSIESIIESTRKGEEGDLYAVEQIRGIAIVAAILDEEMLAAIRAEIKTLEEGEGVVYDQRIERGVEEINQGTGEDVGAEAGEGAGDVSTVSA